MDLSIIKKICEKRPGGLKKLALDIGMSETNLHRCISINKIQASDLEKVAGILKVSILTFFEGQEYPTVYVKASGENAQAAGHDISISLEHVNQKEIIHLRERLADKDELIAALKERIEDLKGGVR